MSLPEHRAAKYFLYPLVINASLIVLEGLVVLVLLLIEPSESGGFLGFSPGRWGLILFHLVSIVLASFFAFKVWKNDALARRTSAWMEKHALALWVLFTALLVAALPVIFEVIPSLASAGFYPRLRPSLLWLAMTSGQMWLSLVFIAYKPFVKVVSRFFPLPESEKSVPQPLTRFQHGLLTAIAVIYILLQVKIHFDAVEASWLPDSIDYVFPASFAWSDAALWTHAKPWGAAVFYKLTGTSPAAIDAAQVILSTLAWLVLAFVFTHVIQNSRLRVFGFVLTLSFSLVPPVARWNHIILSESLSISVMVLILSLWLSLVRRWGWHKFIGLIALFGLWAGTRETNVYISLLIAGILILAGLLRAQLRLYWFLGLSLIAFGWVNLRISEMPVIPRWVYPLTNVVLQRILPNPEFLTYFEDQGMPVSPRLLELSGQSANAQNFAVFNSRALRDFKNWLYRQGKGTYLRFLFEHPAYTVFAPLNELRSLLAYSGTDEGRTGGMAFALASFVTGIIFPTGWLWVFVPLGLSSAAFALVYGSWKGFPAFWLLSGFFLLVAPHLYIVWHGDSAEIGRHAAQASIQLRLSIWLLLLYSLDKIFSLRSRHGI